MISNQDRNPQEEEERSKTEDELFCDFICQILSEIPDSHDQAIES